MCLLIHSKEFVPVFYGRYHYAFMRNNNRASMRIPLACLWRNTLYRLDPEKSDESKTSSLSFGIFPKEKGETGW